MANILDYIEWRGDLTFSQSPFNEIDNLILARLSYFPFDHILNENRKYTIKECYEIFLVENNQEGRVLQQEDLDLFPALANSQRFGDLILGNYVNKIEPIEEKQFSAITVELLDNLIYVSYRGTDNTLVGWKEDFNMSFKELVPAQEEAVNYLEEVAYQHKKSKILVGGHSKGGNLAIYAATFCPKKVSDRILSIYNNDGPGFCEKIIQSKEYQNAVEKMYTYIPQSSVVGRLLNHEETYRIVKSTQVGLMQHDLYSWQVLGREFVCLDELTNGSEFSNRMIKEWLVQVNPEQREQFIDILFQILNTTEATTLSELSAKWFANARVLLKSYHNIDENSKKVISETLYALFNIAKSNLFNKTTNKKEKRQLKKIGGVN